LKKSILFALAFSLGTLVLTMPAFGAERVVVLEEAYQEG
jgi:hypothetical protein